MLYLERHLPLKADMTQLLPSAKSVVVVACNYYWPEPPNPEYKIARYAQGTDYHHLMKRLLQTLEGKLKTWVPELESRVFVDSGPLLEKALASRAGLGWMGKHSNLIHPQKGSWFLLGTLLTNVPFEPSAPFEAMHCGSCTRCIEACPTDAIVEPFVVDGRKCISYLTIETRETIPVEHRETLHDRMFGCDICQEVCPWNLKFAQPTALEDFYPRDWIAHTPLEQLLKLTPREFELKIAPRSPLKRPKYRGFLRNAIVVAGNSGNPHLLPVLDQIKQKHDTDPMISEHIDWAIKQLSNETKQKIWL